MKFIKGIDGYMWVYGYYIDDIQRFLVYASLHPEYTEEYWESCAWVEEYGVWGWTGKNLEYLDKVSKGVRYDTTI